MPCTLLTRRHDTLGNVCHRLGSQSRLARSNAVSRTTRPQLERWIRTKGPPPKKTPGDLHNLAQHIIPGSLTSTINIHRQVNQDAKIRAVKTDPEFWDRGQFEQDGRKRPEPQPNENRPMSLDSSLSESFRNRVAEEASKHGLVQAPVRRLLSEKHTGKERIDKAKHYTGKTYNGHITMAEAESLSNMRRSLLEKHEKQSGQEVLSEDDVKNQMSILRRVRLVLFNKLKTVEADEDFKLPLKYRTVLEYVGKVVPMRFQHAIPQTSVEPWADSGEKTLPAIQRLNAEIEAFMDWVTPTDSEQLAREAVFDTTLGLIRDHLPNLMAARVGSQVTGLAMPTSDADIRFWHGNMPRIEGGNQRAKTIKRAEESRGMEVMYDILKSHPAYTATEKVGGSFPLVDTTHEESGLSVQVVCGASSGNSRRFVKESLEDHPHLKTVFTIVKTALDMRGLSSVYGGGLGSYTVFNMVLAALNLYRIEHTDATEPATPASLLLYVFDFYGNRFNPYAFGIAASPFKLFRKRRQATQAELANAVTNKFLRVTLSLAKPVPFEHYLLCLQDPMDGGNDLGRKSPAFKHVQETMQYLHHTVKHNLVRKDSHRCRCLLRTVIGRCDYEYDERRTKLELFGETCEPNPKPLIRVGPKELSSQTLRNRVRKAVRAQKRMEKEEQERMEKGEQVTMEEEDEDAMDDVEDEDAIETMEEKAQERLMEEQAKEEQLQEEIKEAQRQNEERDKEGGDDLEGYSPSHM